MFFRENRTVLFLILKLFQTGQGCHWWCRRLHPAVWWLGLVGTGGLLKPTRWELFPRHRDTSWLHSLLNKRRRRGLTWFVSWAAQKTGRKASAPRWRARGRLQRVEEIHPEVLKGLHIVRLGHSGEWMLQEYRVPGPFSRAFQKIWHPRKTNWGWWVQ